MNTLTELLGGKSSDLLSKYQQVEWRVTSGFPGCLYPIEYASDYGPRHYTKVKEDLALLLPEDLKSQMAAEEVFLLLCTARFQDFVLRAGGATGEIGQHSALAPDIRAFDYLDQCFGDCMAPSEIYALKSTLAGLSGDVTQVPAPLAIGRAQVRVRFLAALLRLANSLDLDFIPGAQLSHRLNIFPADRTKYWRARASISGVWIDARSWRIKVTALPVQLADKALVEALIAEVQQELDQLGPILELHGLHYRQIELKYANAVIDPPPLPPLLPHSHKCALTPAEEEMLKDALLDAFEREDLERVVYYGLEVKPRTIVKVGNFEQEVSDLVSWVNRKNKVKPLLEKALDENSGNLRLQQFAAYIQAKP